MEDKSTPAHLTSEQLARLWSIGSDSEWEQRDADMDQKRQGLLLDHLAGSLPPDPALIELLPEILGSLCQQLRPFTGESLRTLLLDPEVDLSVLERIKDHAKALGATAGSDIEREVALALYFAAIAAGLLYHRTRVSQQSWAHLEQSFKTLSRQPWVPSDLAELFTRAAPCCTHKR